MFPTKRTALPAMFVFGLLLSGGFMSARAEDGVIRLGAPIAVTGALADSGMKEEQGFEMAVEAINARGGVHVGTKHLRLELVKYDYQSQTNRAIQLVQRLITVDHVDFLLAPYGSGDTKATAALAERYGIPMIAPSAATNSVYDQQFKNIFGILFQNRAIADAEVGYIHLQLPQAKTLAVMSMNSLYPKSIAAELKHAAEAAGFQIVFDEVYAPNTSDFADSLSQIKAHKPDWIYVSGYTQDLIQVRRQMNELGVTSLVTTMTAGPAYPEFRANLGAVADNVTTDSWWWPTAGYKDSYLFGSSQGYSDAFNKIHHRDPSYLEAAATAGVEVLAEAIEAAGTTDHAAVRGELAQRQFSTFYGPIKFGPTGQNIQENAIVLQIQHGKIVILAPKDLQQGKLIVPAAPK
jgi:branched-chain amino acid transport system substrate-binding protein